MTLPIIQCAFCKHFDATRRGGNFCTAYPEAPGIPTEIIVGRVDHRKPYAGDRGIQWEPIREGEEHPFGSFEEEPTDG